MTANPRQRKAPCSDGAFSKTINCEPQANDTRQASKSQQCKHFDRCSAPICPLNDSWQKRTHLDGEPICIYLRELVKPDGKRNLATSLPCQLLELIERQAKCISLRYGPIARRLKRASKCGSRMVAGKALKSNDKFVRGKAHE